MKLEYNFTDITRTPVATSMTLGDLARLREVLESLLKDELPNVSKWQLRDLRASLASAQSKAADTLRYEAEALAKAAKLSDE